MINFLKLYINENIKLFKKKSTKIFIILAVASLFLSYGIVALNKNIENSYAEQDQNNEIVLGQIDGLKEQLKNADEVSSINLKTEIEVYEYAVKNNIKLFYMYTNYESDLIYKLIAEKKTLNSIDKDFMKAEYDKQKVVVDTIQNILDTKDFNKYIEMSKEKIQKDYNNKTTTEFVYNLSMRREDLKLKYEVNKYTDENSSWKKNILDEIFSIENIINNRFNESEDKYLTDEDIQVLEDKKLVSTYKLENNIKPDSRNGSTSSRDMYESFSISASLMFIGLLLIIAASSSISEEVSKGTIKFLVIVPFKRYKILLAKLLTFAVTLVILTLILSQLNILVGDIFFEENANDYIYAVNNKIEVMNSRQYMTSTYLLYMPEIFIYILLGMVLSTTIRNTAIANTLSIMIYIGSPVAMSIIGRLLAADWLKYLPLNNFNLVNKVLPTNNIFNSDVMFGMQFDTTLQFSVIVLSITAVLLLITMFESFNKRDII